VAVTQPRRVAAITVARRVAEEVGCVLGERVGYAIRFDDCTSAHTMLKYVTDGMLLRELLTDPLLAAYGMVFLDEAHERTVRTDVLFGLLKAVQARRAASASPLRLVVMSATLDTAKLVAFFGPAPVPVVRVPGRLYPVRQFYTREPQSDCLDAALVATLQLHVEAPPGDVLVFLAGQDEIESVEELLLEHAPRCPPSAPALMVRPLYAALPPAQQVQVFEPTPPGCRKVILATNIAETSVTINGVRYVIDTGYAKERAVQPRVGVETLQVVPISQAAAAQRSGRAGREAAGQAYRLYTEAAHAQLAPAATPEILRVALTGVVLMLKAYGVDDVLGFAYVDAPSREAVLPALEELYALGALDDDGRLSDAGRRMAQFPVDPPLAKVLLAGQAHRCGDDVAAMVALLSVESVFYSPRHAREQADDARRKFVSAQGDHVTALNVLAAYDRVGGDAAWCHAHFLNARALRQVCDVRAQLRRVCGQLGLPLESAGEDRARVLRALLAGFFLHTAVRQQDGTYRTLQARHTVAIHPSSCLATRRPPCVLYHELVQTSRQFIRTVSAIDVAWIAEAAPRYFGRVKAPLALS
jgi:HrpA-like RNA helicase